MNGITKELQSTFTSDDRAQRQSLPFCPVLLPPPPYPLDHILYPFQPVKHPLPLPSYMLLISSLFPPHFPSYTQTDLPVPFAGFASLLYSDVGVVICTSMLRVY